MPMDRMQLFDRVHESWQEFRQSFEGLSEAEMREPGVAGDWSARDLVIHVAVWEQEALTALPLLLEGKRARRYGNIDRFNEEQRQLHASHGPAQAVEKLADTHARLLDYLRTLPEPALESETRVRH